MNQITNTVKASLLASILPESTDIYVALLTTLPADYDGTGLAELDSTWYARVAHDAWVNATDDGVVSRKNNGAVVFSATDAAESGIIGWAIYDAATNGNLIACGPIHDADGEDASIDLAIGDVLQFQTQDIEVRL